MAFDFGLSWRRTTAFIFYIFKLFESFRNIKPSQILGIFEKNKHQLKTNIDHSYWMTDVIPIIPFQMYVVQIFLGNLVSQI